MKIYRILAINPGSTSTKVALFENDKKVFSSNVDHDASELAQFENIADQMPYRLKTIDDGLKASGIELGKLDACVGRGGGLLAMEGGTYKANPLMLEHAETGANGVVHPAQLGLLIAKHYAKSCGCPEEVYTVNPPDVDEFHELARCTGVKGVYRQSHLHALNLKETAIHHSKLNGKKYENSNYVVCRIGGGISVSAHYQGKMIDGNDIVKGEGPMAPTRCGTAPVGDIVRLCSIDGIGSVKQLCTRTGGFVNHLGTSDAREVENRAEAGEEYPKLIWETTKYQIAKYIGSMAAVLKGNVDGILLSGGMVYSKDLVKTIEEYCGFIAPITAYPGEMEMEAMTQGVIRVLTGVEESKNYTAAPIWDRVDTI